MAGLHDHHRADTFAEVRVGHAEYRRFIDAGHVIDQQLHLLRVDVVAAGDDQVLVTAADAQVAIGIDMTEIPGDEEAILAELAGGLLRHLPVALEDIGTPHLDQPCLATRQGGTCLAVGDADFAAGQRHAHRAGTPLAVVGVGGVHVGLGHPVALENRVAGACAELAVGLAEQRRGAGDEQPHAGGRLAIEALGFQQAGVEGRHAHQHAGARHQIQNLLGIELRQEGHRGAHRQHDVAGHEQAVGVEDWQGVDQMVITGEAPGLGQRLTVGGQIGVGQHRALAAPGGAGGIEDGGEIIGGAWLDFTACAALAGLLHQGAVLLGAQTLDTRHITFLAQCACRLQHLGLADVQVRPGVAQEVADLLAGVGGIQRQIDRADLQAGQIQDDGLAALVDLHRDAVARCHAQLA